MEITPPQSPKLHMKALPLALLIIQPLIVSHACLQRKYWRREKPGCCVAEPGVLPVFGKGEACSMG